MTLLITKGKQGSEIIKDGRVMKIPTKPLKEIDPTGAGDLFVAGFAYGLLEGRNLIECAKFGNYFGGLCVRYKGVPIFDKKDIDIRKII